jgi:phage gp46-like protein
MIDRYSENLNIYELHIKPTYAVCIPQRNGYGGGRTTKQLANEENLKNNKHTGDLSRKAQTRIKNAVNWLIASSKTKSVFVKELDKQIKFKISFITLTLPTTDHNISDNFFKSKLLHNFINAARYSNNLQNFVWKVEAQANGNIHAHITTDIFIHWKDLRRIWNRILKKNGLIDKYQDKHKRLTLEEYLLMYGNKKNSNLDILTKAYATGKSENWENPNSTDIHSVQKINNLGAYLSKYLAKNDSDRRKISGKLWSCSYNLSEQNKLIVELCDTQDQKYIDCVSNVHIKQKDIMSKLDENNEQFLVGSLYLYKLDDWGKYIKGPLLELYNEHRFNIRNNIHKPQVDKDSLILLNKPIPVCPPIIIQPKQQELGFLQN